MKIINRKIDNPKQLGYVTIKFNNGNVLEYTLLLNDYNNVDSKNLKHTYHDILKKHALNVRTISKNKRT
jgi:hypothetical protein